MFLICTNCHFSCAALVWRIIWIFSFCLVFSFNTNVHSLSFSAILILAFFSPSSWFNCSCSSELPLSPPHFNGSARLYALDWDVLEHIAVLSVSDSSGWFTVPWDLLSTLWCPLWVSLVSGRRWVCVLCLVYWAPGRLGLARHRTRTPFSHTQTGPLILLSALSLFITQITQKPDACSCCLPGPFSHSFSLSPTSFYLGHVQFCILVLAHPFSSLLVYLVSGFFQCPTNTCQFQPAVSMSLSFYLPLPVIIYHSRFSIPVLCLPESYSEISKRELWSAHSTAHFFVDGVLF